MTKLPDASGWRAYSTTSGRVMPIRDEAHGKSLVKSTKDIIILKPGAANPPGSQGAIKQGLLQRVVNAILDKAGF